MKRLSWLCVLLVTALAVGQGAALQRKAKVGDTLKYKLEMNLLLFGDTATYTSTLTEKILSVETNGNYAVERSQSNYKVEFGGEEGTVADEDTAKTVTTFTPSGEVVSIKSDLLNASVYRLAQMETIHLPGKEVKKDETWTYEVAADEKTGVAKAKADYKVVGEEKIGNHDCWQISINYLETESTPPASVTGNVWLDKADGSIVKLETAWNDAPIPGAPSPVGGSYKLERID